jgi:hypothetical protein
MLPLTPELGGELCMHPTTEDNKPYSDAKYAGSRRSPSELVSFEGISACRASID